MVRYKIKELFYLIILGLLRKYSVKALALHATNLSLVLLCMLLWSLTEVIHEYRGRSFPKHHYSNISKTTKIYKIIFILIYKQGSRGKNKTNVFTIILKIIKYLELSQEITSYRRI